MVIYSLRQSLDGNWSIRRDSATLFSQLRLGPAIQLAREAARDEHNRSGAAPAWKCPAPPPPSAWRNTHVRMRRSNKAPWPDINT